MSNNTQNRQLEQDRLREETIQEAFRQSKVSRTRFPVAFAISAFAPLQRKSRKLAESPQAWAVLHRLLQHQDTWVNQVSTWKPRGKAVKTLLRGLIRHLICKYPMPEFWYSVWFEGTERMYNQRGGARDAVVGLANPNVNLIHNFVKLAQGTGMYKLVKEDAFSVFLTKKQCHALMQQRKVRTVPHAIRWTQVQSFGGERSLAKTLCDTRWGDACGDRVFGAFQSTVIQWFCAQGMLDMTQVGPLIDYVEHCRWDNGEWSINGRTVVSLMRDMEGWHRDLAVQHRGPRAASVRYKPPPEIFSKSGLESWSESRKTKDSRGRQVHEEHRVDELLTYKGLLDEGQALHHCVSSYAHNIGRGSTSIWSYSKDQEKLLTLEVHNPTRTLRQVRGSRNRMPTSAEMLYVQKWAREARVSIVPRAVRRGW